MPETSLAIRIFTSEVAGQQKMFAFVNATNDPHAHEAWCKVNLDLTEGLGLTVKASSGVVAFAERFDTFEFGESEVYLHYEGDPGDLTLSANNNSDLNLLVQKLETLGGYVVTHVP